MRPRFISTPTGFGRTEIRARERFVDQNDARRVPGVARLDSASGSYANAQCLEISRRDIAQFDRERRLAARWRALDEEVGRVAPPAPVLKRQHLRKARGLHTRHLRHALGDVVVLRLDPLRRRLAEMERQHVPGHHAVICVPQPLHLADDERGAARKHERQRDLCDNQPVAHATVTRVRRLRGRPPSPPFRHRRARQPAPARCRRTPPSRRTPAAETRTPSSRTRPRACAEFARSRTRRAGCSSIAPRRRRQDRRPARAAGSRS